MGSSIIIQTILAILRIGLNLAGYIYHWDVYPYIAKSCFLDPAACVVPIIMMAQN